MFSLDVGVVEEATIGSIVMSLSGYVEGTNPCVFLIPTVCSIVYLLEWLGW